MYYVDNRDEDGDEVGRSVGWIVAVVGRKGDGREVSEVEVVEVRLD